MVKCKITYKPKGAEIFHSSFISIARIPVAGDVVDSDGYLMTVKRVILTSLQANVDATSRAFIAAEAICDPIKRDDLYPREDEPEQPHGCQGC